jgi:hypothetical protein
MVIIPTFSNPYYTQTTVIDGTPYLLEFRFNFREQVWYLDISLADGTVLALGIKLVSNFRLLQKYADSRMPPGEIVAIAYGSNDSPAGLDELGLGLRVELTYLEVADMPNMPEGWRNPA